MAFFPNVIAKTKYHCKDQFRYRRWDCTTIDKTQFGVDLKEGMPFKNQFFAINTVDMHHQHRIMVTLFCVLCHLLPSIFILYKEQVLCYQIALIEVAGTEKVAIIE